MKMYMETRRTTRTRTKGHESGECTLHALAVTHRLFSYTPPGLRIKVSIYAIDLGSVRPKTQHYRVVKFDGTVPF